MAPESISTAHVINPSHQFVYLYVYPHIVARQRLSKKVTAVTNTQVPIEKFLYANFHAVHVISRKVGD
jgi:hypothetical protein